MSTVNDIDGNSIAERTGKFARCRTKSTKSTKSLLMACLDSLAECEVHFIDQDLEINRDESEREIIVVAMAPRLFGGARTLDRKEPENGTILRREPDLDG